MKCSKCHIESDSLIITINQQTGEKQYICDICFFSSSVEELEKIEEVEAQILEVEKMVKIAKSIVEVGREPDLSMFSKEAAAFAFTPAKGLKTSESLLKSLKIKKQNILEGMSEINRLTYKLKDAVDQENFQLAAKLRDKINALK